MSLAYKVGNFVQPTATNATFGVTGIGFIPKALILYATDETGLGVGTSWTQYFGMATTTSNRGATSNYQITATNTSDRANDNSKCFVIVNTSGTTIVAAELVSFDSDGFTLNFSTVDLIARIVGYIAIGGTDLTNAFIKQFTPTASSNIDQAFTGVGFKPDAMFLISGGVGTTPANDVNNMGAIISFTAGVGKEQAITGYPTAATESALVAKTISRTSGGGAFTMTGTLKSFDSDGFTINFTVSSSVKVCYALCLKGGQYNVGVFNQATSNGNQAKTGIGFQPTGLILMSVDAASNANLITTQSRFSFGSASDSSNRLSVWDGGGNAGIINNDVDSSKILNMITEGASPTTNTAADFVSFDSDGFTINNTTTDATAREIAYMVFGSTAVTIIATSNLSLLGAG